MANGKKGKKGGGLATPERASLVYRVLPYFINKQLSIESFLNWKGHLGFASLLKGSVQTTASDSLTCLVFKQIQIDEDYRAMISL